MRTLTHSAFSKIKRKGHYHSVEHAIQQKQAALLNVLAGADLTSLSVNENSLAEQPTGNNVSDVPYEEVE